MKIRKSDVLGLLLFVGWIPGWLLLGYWKILDPVILLIFYPIGVIPLYYFMKKFEGKEREAMKLI